MFNFFAAVVSGLLVALAPIVGYVGLPNGGLGFAVLAVIVSVALGFWVLWVLSDWLSVPAARALLAAQTLGFILACDWVNHALAVF
jgi:hypothetical protein